MENSVIDNGPKKISAGRITRTVFFIVGLVVFAFGAGFYFYFYQMDSGEAGIAVGIVMMILAVITLIGLAVMALAYFWHRPGDKSRHLIRNLVLVFIILLVVGWLLWFIFHPRPVVFVPSP